MRDLNLELNILTDEATQYIMYKFNTLGQQNGVLRWWSRDALLADGKDDYQVEDNLQTLPAVYLSVGSGTDRFRKLHISGVRHNETAPNQIELLGHEYGASEEERVSLGYDRHVLIGIAAAMKKHFDDQ